MPPVKARRFDNAARYRIRVEGEIGVKGSALLGEMDAVFHPAAGTPGVTDLTGPVTDQAALMGILDQLYCSGATVLSVERLEADAEPEDAAY
jgi:hypothetical protein